MEKLPVVLGKCGVKLTGDFPPLPPQISNPGELFIWGCAGSSFLHALSLDTVSGAALPCCL